MTEDETWSGETTLTGDVTVPGGTTLTLEAGTTIYFQAGADDQSGGSDGSRVELIVEGALIIEGTAESPVVLTSASPTPTAGLWGGIRMTGGGTLIMRHAVVEYGTLGVDYQVGAAVAASVTIEDSVIRYTTGNGIYLSTSSGATLTALLGNNTIHDHSSYGISLYNNASTLAPTLTGNLVYANSSGVYLNNYGTLSGARVGGNEIRNNSGDGIYIRPNSGAAATIHVEGNNVHDNNRGLYWYATNGSTTAVIRGNTFSANSTYGVYLNEYYSGRTHPQLNLNRIQGNGSWGIYASKTAGADIVNNQLSGNAGGGINLVSPTQMARISFNDLGGDNGAYEVQNSGGLAVDARYNWWGAATTAEMAAGGNPKNIVRIYDIFDNSSYGAVDYGQWLTAAPTLVEEPVSWVKSPVDGAVLKAEVVSIEGSASAAEDIDRVEVSTDGGTTWVVAEGTLSWRYDWTVPGDGSYLLRSRVVTAGGVLETPSAGNRVTLDSTQPGTPGTLVEDETWDGDLYITGDITVPAGVTLTIAPGSIITFAPNEDDLFGGSDPSKSELVVEGALIMQGTADAPIVLTSDAPFPLPGDWAGIKVVNGILDMQYATVEYATHGILCEGDTQPVECTITDSTIRSNSGYGIYSHAIGGGVVDIWLEKNDVRANQQGGAYLYSQGGTSGTAVTAVLLDNAFRNNENYGVYVYTYSSAVAQAEFTENLFEGNGQGVYVYNRSASPSSTYTFFANDFAGNGTGLRYYNYTSNIDPEISNNLVHDNLSFGIHLSTYGTAYLAPTLYNNTIIDNGQGIYAKATDILTAAQNQLYGNTIDIYNDAPVDIDARQNWWGTSTTNVLATGTHPRDLSNIYDAFDDPAKGYVEYSDWLTLFDRPPAPTLDPVETPVAAETQTLSGSKAADTGIGVNGRLLLAPDDQTTWTADITLREGDNPLSVYAVDPSGIISDLVSALIVKDTEPPRILSSIPAADSVVSTQIAEVEIVVYDEATEVDFDHVVAQASLTGSEGNVVPGAWSADTGHLVFTAQTYLAPDTYTVSLSLADTPLGNTASVLGTDHHYLHYLSNGSQQQTGQRNKDTEDTGEAVWRSVIRGTSPFTRCSMR